jgi:hypothetical protein
VVLDKLLGDEAGGAGPAGRGLVEDVVDLEAAVGRGGEFVELGSEDWGTRGEEGKSRGQGRGKAVGQPMSNEV